MSSLSSGDVTFNISSSGGSGDSSSIHQLNSIEVGGEVYSDLVGPDEVVFNIVDIPGVLHETRIFIGANGEDFDTWPQLWPSDGNRNPDFEQQALNDVFRSDDLNAFIDNYRLDPNQPQPGYTLNYNTPITVTPDGFIVITENGGNANKTVEFLDEFGNVMAAVNAIDKNQDDGNYLNMGVTTVCTCNIHGAVFRLSDIPDLQAGDLIHSVRVTLEVDDTIGRPGVVGEGGDGKVFFFGHKDSLQPPEDPVNQPPVAIDAFFDGLFNEEISGNALLEDFDPDDDPFEVKEFTQPSNGTVTMQPDGSFTYTPDTGFFGVDSFTYRITDGTDPSDFATVQITVPCFAAGTLIATAQGPKLVEDIRVGDKVLTREDGFKEVRWAGQRRLSADDLTRNPDFVSVLIRAGALGNGLPRRDLRVSPGHRMLVSGQHAELLFGERDVLVAASDLVGEPGITRDPRPVTYVHLMFDCHQIIDSEGTWSESFQPADVTLKGLDDQQRKELLALFPELASKKGQRGYVAARRVLTSHETSALLSV